MLIKDLKLAILHTYPIAIDFTKHIKDALSVLIKCKTCKLETYLLSQSNLILIEVLFWKILTTLFSEIKVQQDVAIHINTIIG